MKGKFVHIAATMTVDGTLDLSGVTDDVDTVVKAVDNDTAVTLAFVADSQYDKGHLDETAYPAIVFHFKSAATKVSDFEAEVTASHHMAVTAAGTGTNVLVTGDDEFSATPLASGTLSADADSATVDVTGLTNVSAYLNQVVDAGNASLLVEKSVDGINWATVATKAQSDFPAGANKSIELAMSDANGMPTLAKQIRMTLSGHSSTGEYTLTAAGIQLSEYR